MPATPDLSRPSLAALAYVLRHHDDPKTSPLRLPPWSYTDRHCCALGWADALWSTSTKLGSRFILDELISAPGASRPVGMDIFYNLQAPRFRWLSFYDRQMRHVGPLDVARAIDRYLANDPTKESP